jgi:hypothetical protein
MGGHTKAPATTRLRIFSRGFSLQSLPRQPAHTRNTRPRRFDTFKEWHYPLARLRFASGTSKSRVSVSTSTSEPAKISSSVRVHINDAVSTTHPSCSLVLSLTKNRASPTSSSPRCWLPTSGAAGCSRSLAGAELDSKVQPEIIFRSPQGLTVQRSGAKVLVQLLYPRRKAFHDIAIVSVRF